MLNKLLRPAIRLSPRIAFSLMSVQALKLPFELNFLILLYSSGSPLHLVSRRVVQILSWPLPRS